jgi:serine/threonine protein kinase
MAHRNTGLEYPAEWKFEGVGFPMPRGAVSAFRDMLLSVAEGSHPALEDFKVAFGGSTWSSAYDWAITDLTGLIDSRGDNAALFLDSVWKCLGEATTRNLRIPSPSYINKILSDHSVPFLIEPPHLRLSTDRALIVATEADASSVPAGYAATFLLKEEIGKGGYGVVHRAVRTTTVGDFEFAVKILYPSPFIANQDKALKRFHREIAVLRSLQHRAIVPFYEAGLTNENKPYVVMPLIRGTDLRSAASAAGFVGTVSLFIEVLSALHYAHQNDVVHRDLKPSNILVRSTDRQPIILDFGCAYILDELDSKTLTTQAVGTIGYIPSEVLADPTTRSPLQDVYACGVMLYEAIAGRRPDPANYVPLEKIGAGFRALDPIVQRAIAGAPARMTTAREFGEQLSLIPL